MADEESRSEQGKSEQYEENGSELNEAFMRQQRYIQDDLVLSVIVEAL